MRNTLLASLILFIAGSRPFPEIPEPARAWAPVLRLGSAGGRTEEGVVEVARLLRLSQAFALDRRLDAEAQRMLDTIRDQVEALDSSRLYRMLPPSGEPGDATRAFDFSGRLRLTSGYAVRSGRSSGPVRFGDADARIALRPARERSFLLTTHASLHVGLTAAELFACAADALSWFSELAGARDDRRRGLGAGDLSVLGGLATAFPAASALAARYLEVRDVAAPAPRGPRVRLAVRLRKAPFEQDYPNLAKAVSGAAQVLSTRVRAMTAGGRTLGVWKLDSSEMEGMVSFEPVLESLVQERYRFEADLASNASGVKVAISKVHVETAVRAGPERVVISSRVHRMPEVSVAGAALEIIPVAVIDALIPSNLSGIIREFLSVLTTGDGGKGLSWTVSVPRADAEPIRTTTRAELLDNGFVSFWLRIASRAIRFDDEVRDELEGLMGRVLEAVRSDFERMQAVL